MTRILSVAICQASPVPLHFGAGIDKAVALARLDTDGHYSRSDVFELSVDTRAQDGFWWSLAR